jgi:hypothetical protein
MPRKSDGTTSSRRKKSSPAETPAVQPAPVQTPEVSQPAPFNSTAPAPTPLSNVTPINVAPLKAAKKTPAVNAKAEASLDEEIRQRAYELFLERKGAAGDPAADWLTAEREVRTRHAKDGAFAAKQGS